MATWEQVQNNPTLFDGAMQPGEGNTFRWHDEADAHHSSQVFCVSAFGTLRNLAVRDSIASRFLLGEQEAAGNDQWGITLEATDRSLLGESGHGEPTNVDALFQCDSKVICVEAKFLTDARAGFGSCSQPGAGKCAGFYGPGSDKAQSTKAWCRLENWDGRRSPRLYWTLGRAFFLPDVFYE